ncbi:uncharacterized protein EDB91DRAFT_1065957 [Suillus paluster]|uniref:uncharacterized protein n=1 Tax=Suillus paluster TaxID=48578 RepID=UPI001B86C0AE|nr:uncharacterized protein EDB91DRAFT_1065957 [Suillus paluster]KAG1719043.1 hypothetical protein EDB91DRAFT_1065957 [Suillus paluster]
MQTGQGMKNLNQGVAECAARRGVSMSGANSTGMQQTITGSVSKYTAEAHHALIALRCVVNKCLFHSVANPLYIEEVKLLRPDVQVPSPRTVSCDINTIYCEASKNDKIYFSVRFIAKTVLLRLIIVAGTCRLNSPCHRRVVSTFCLLVPWDCRCLV